MKCSFDGIYLKFDEFNESEIKAVEKLLTWEEDNWKAKETLLLYNEAGDPFSFWGLHKLLQDKLGFLELRNPRKYNFEKVHDIPKDLLNGIELYNFQVTGIRKALIIKIGLEEIPTGGWENFCDAWNITIFDFSWVVKTSFNYCPLSIPSRSIFKGSFRGGVFCK